jgi:outer membrane protein assembly factor BamB
MVLLDGNDGRIVVDDIRERGGFFSEIGRDFKEQVKEDLLVSQRVDIKYFHKELPQLGTILLFNQVEKGDQVQSYDLKTGEEKWSSTSYLWNLDKYKDIANIAINEVMGGSLGAKGMSAVALQTRLIQSMIQEVPEKDAFLFRTVEKLYLIKHETGEVLWENEAMAGTGIAAVNYLPQSNKILIASSMSGLRDVLENVNEEQELKQLILVDANTGDFSWKSEYQGRSEQVKSIAVKNDKVHLNFNGGSMEIFDFSDGERIWGTRDGSLEGNTKLASFTGDYNLMETIETAAPQLDGEYLYAVNPKNVKAVGLPDKQLQEFDYAAGGVLWGVGLEEATHVRDVLLEDDEVIEGVSSGVPAEESGNVSNIVGEVKD